MKRIIVTILIATSLLTLAACTEDQKNKAAVEAIETAEVSSNVASRPDVSRRSQEAHGGRSQARVLRIRGMARICRCLLARL